MTKDRGKIEMTRQTFDKLFPYTKGMPQFRDGRLFYTSYPIIKVNARIDALITPDGKRTELCL